MRSHMRISSALWALILPLITALPALAQEPEQNSWIQGRLSELDSILGGTVGFLASILLFDFGTGVPFIVGVLLVGGIYYTLFFGFFSIRAFGHSIDVVRGLYDDPDDPGEISHFKALTSALSATIGLGNIAGVAVAIGRVCDVAERLGERVRLQNAFVLMEGGPAASQCINLRGRRPRRRRLCRLPRLGRRERRVEGGAEAGVVPERLS